MTEKVVVPTLTPDEAVKVTKHCLPWGARPTQAPAQIGYRQVRSRCWAPRLRQDCCWRDSPPSLQWERGRRNKHLELLSPFLELSLQV